MANRPLTYTQRFLLEHPICCFCGGNTPATTRDHVPAKIIFDGRHRPRRIEVPACEQCQQFTKKHELAAAMFARIFCDPSTPAQNGEVEKLFRRANKAIPGLLEELQATPEQEARLEKIKEQEPNAAGVLNAGGPLVNASLDIFGVKTTCALHFEKTKKIVPVGGPISTRIFTNVDVLEDNLPKALLNVLGPPNTLQQGNWSVSNQFSYSYAITDTHEYGAYFSTFRQSFAVLGLIWKGMDDLPEGEGMKTFTPQKNGQFLRIR